MSSNMKNVLGVAALLVIGGVAYYAISPLFRTVEVQDELPESTVQEQQERTEADDTAAQSDQESASIPRFDVMGTTGHPASGTVRVFDTAGGQVIRYENFKTINGPNLHVYLAKDLNADDYIDLGPIKGTEGNINYNVPDGVDLSEYRYVMYWCVPFSVLFNYAEIR